MDGSRTSYCVVEVAFHTSHYIWSVWFDSDSLLPSSLFNIRNSLLKSNWLVEVFHHSVLIKSTFRKEINIFWTWSWTAAWLNRGKATDFSFALEVVILFIFKPVWWCWCNLLSITCQRRWVLLLCGKSQTAAVHLQAHESDFVHNEAGSGRREKTQVKVFELFVLQSLSFSSSHSDTWGHIRASHFRQSRL